jgi:hypothetical protein
MTARNGASYPTSALGAKFKTLKYKQYSFGLNLPPALNSGKIHHFWTAV